MEFHEYCGQYVGCNPISIGKAAEARINELEGALRGVVQDIEDYERVNKLHPNPGKSDCWQSVTHAKQVLSD